MSVCGRHIPVFLHHMLFVSTGLVHGDLYSAFDILKEALNVNISFLSRLLGFSGLQTLVITYSCVEIHLH